VKTLVRIFMIGMSAFSALADDGKPGNAPERISIYEVAFQCPAVPAIGCGSHAKPILLKLERQTLIREAWLNHAGTELALVWKEGATPTGRAKAVETILKDEAASELKGKAREKALAEFSAGIGWYRGEALDRLSAEEADAIAGRIERKIRGVVTITDKTAAALHHGFGEAIKRRLIGDLPDRSSTEAEVLKVCRRQLSREQVEAVQIALKDYQPRRDDQ
jgi:hypothetical protein